MERPDERVLSAAFTHRGAGKWHYGEASVLRSGARSGSLGAAARPTAVGHT